MKFEDALKQARRNTFIFGKDWRVAVIADSPAKLAIAWDEAKYQIEASSLKLERANYMTRTMELERGAIIRFFVVEDTMDAYKLSGGEFTQMMFLQGEYHYPTLEYLKSVHRSASVPTDKLLWQEYVTL